MLFLRHFATRIDPNAPAASWVLTDEARRAVTELIASGRFSSVKRVLSSPETKALWTAEEIGRHHGIPVAMMPEMAEVNRTGVGFLGEGYREAVRCYLTGNPDPQYPFEPIESVEARIAAWLAEVEGDGAADLCVCHGLWLSILLSDHLGMDRFEFWDSLKFGHLLEVDCGLWSIIA